MRDNKSLQPAGIPSTPTGVHVEDLVVVRRGRAIVSVLSASVLPGTALALITNTEDDARRLVAVLTGSRRATYGAISCGACGRRRPAPVPRAPSCLVDIAGGWLPLKAHAAVIHAALHEPRVRVGRAVEGAMQSNLPVLVVSSNRALPDWLPQRGVMTVQTCREGEHRSE